jgi:metal-responsive CopG/Arc/MetJ family transcriptional regulator
MYGDGVSELRTEKVSVTVTPSLLERLDAYRDPRRWSRSTAIAALIEEGLDQEQKQQEASP